jgi:hypothetical protein
MFIHHILSKNKERRERSWWHTQLRRSRTVCSGALLLADLPLQEICGQHNNYTRMAPQN